MRHFVSGARELHGRASVHAHRASRIRRPDRHGASARNAPMPGRPSHAARSTPEQLPVDAVYMTPCSGM
ncbi:MULTISPECIES: hypothetical protein [pseudomallei group]|uniref:hypothetical protein n=1 Tax=pseudomallei group TaxID=111527 RepID=UPI0009E4D727|nr:hypothetical protein [Burkholderia pseudomallei]PPF04978.1 hypothetical protein B9D88_023800 [Burkholderia pseudomallei]